MEEGRVFTHCMPDPQLDGERICKNYKYPFHSKEWVVVLIQSNLIFFFFSLLSHSRITLLFLHLSTNLFFISSSFLSIWSKNTRTNICYSLLITYNWYQSLGLILGIQMFSCFLGFCCLLVFFLLSVVEWFTSYFLTVFLVLLRGVLVTVFSFF